MITLTRVILTLPSILPISALTLIDPSLVLPGSNLVNANFAHECSGLNYGRNLDSASCIEALSQIDASSTIEQTYGQRYTGRFDVKLPKRYISCSSSIPDS